MPRQEAARLFPGDRVRAELSASGEVESLEVIEHAIREVVGTFRRSGDRRGGVLGWVRFERRNAREDIPVTLASKGSLPPDGHWVRIELRFRDHGPFPVTGRLVEALGLTIPASSDIGMIAGELGLVEAHAPEAIAEAEAFPREVSRGGRTDLTNVPFLTIDGETARDFDDAVHVDHRDGGFTLWVAIADVSTYVRVGSALDSEARARGTSVYFPERAFHMLPSALSEGLCSLKPGVPRLAFTCRAELDQDGRPRKTELFESVIRSRRRATYTEIEAERSRNEGNRDWEFAAHFGLFRLLRRRRLGRGALDFDLPEAETKVDAEGNPTSIRRLIRNDAHRLIEEFMIAANEAVTVWAIDRKIPFLYRVHDEPARKSISEFAANAAASGKKLHLSPERPLVRVLSEYLREIAEHPLADYLNYLLLRSLKQAVYSEVNAGHFGLASVAYTHFTSPIRRYPDLVVHRLLRAALRGQKPARAAELEAIAAHCSHRERVAADAERQAVRLKQARFMAAHLGEEFDGVVVHVADSGVIVRFEDPFVEGFLPWDASSGPAPRVGTRLRVSVVRTDLEARRVELALLGARARRPDGARQFPPRGRHRRRMRS